MKDARKNRSNLGACGASHLVFIAKRGCLRAATSNGREQAKAPERSVRVGGRERSLLSRHDKKVDGKQEGGVCPGKWFVFPGTLRRVVLTGSGRDGLVWDQARFSLRSKQPLTGACGARHHVFSGARVIARSDVQRPGASQIPRPTHFVLWVLRKRSARGGREGA